MSAALIRSGAFWVWFPHTDQRFPIRYMRTSDQYEVELPCGVYGGAFISDLRRELERDFVDVKVTT